MTSLGVRPSLSWPLSEESSVFPINLFWFLRRPPNTEGSHLSTTVVDRVWNCPCVQRQLGPPCSVTGKRGGRRGPGLPPGPRLFYELQEHLDHGSANFSRKEPDITDSNYFRLSSSHIFCCIFPPSPFLQPFKNIKTLLRRQAIKYRPTGCNLWSKTC